MDNCKIAIWLAYAMSAYCLASIFYLIGTRWVGTPFKDSLTPQQIEEKNKSSKTRYMVFFGGIALSILILYYFKPFQSCSSFDLQ